VTDDEAIRQAAWHVYVGLHGLAAGQSRGELPTAAGQDGELLLGDLDHARAQVREHGPVVARAHPDLAHRVAHAVARWQDHPSTRLTELLPLLDKLEEISGGALPLTLPPL
jgi:hypothetical protein